MSYEKGKNALEKESVLLNDLEGVAQDYVAALPKDDVLAGKIARQWVESFAKLRELNASLVKDNDEEFEEILSQERDLLGDLITTAKAHGGFGASWVLLFKKDIEIVDGLLDKS